MVTTLTARESVVLHLIAWGFTHKEIAIRLSLSVKTIESHKFNGMRKLKTGTRADLVRYALQCGWLHRDALPDTSAAASPQLVAGNP